jgi:hypothetical protein
MGVVYVPLVIINGRTEELAQGDFIKNCTETLKFTFTPPVQVWVIPHKLGKYPTVTTLGAGGVEVHGSVEYVDLNTIRVTFSKPVEGVAYIN